MGYVKNLIVRIGADFSEFSKGMNDAGKYLKNASKDLKKIGKNLTLGVTVPLIAIGAAAIKAGADFEEAMSGIKAVSGATSDEMEKFHDLALEMGKDTKYSAKEAANGIEELLKAGVSTTDILNGGLSGALTLAAAGGIELADAAEIASTALNAFRKDNLSVAAAADILAGAANASATDIAGLREGLQQAAAVASGVGMSFKDTTTALAVFAQNGLKGSDAGTSLKTMLLNLQPQTKKQIALFKKLGLVTADGSNAFFDQEGHIKSLADISGILKDKLGNMTDQQRLATLEMLFGSDAIRAANILYGEGKDGITNMAAAMDKVKAADVAATKMDNLKGSLENLKGSLETLGITLYETEQGPLKALVDKMTELINKFLELTPEQQNAIVKFGLIAAAIGPAVYMLGLLIGTVSKVVLWASGISKAIALVAEGTKGFGYLLTMIFGPGGVVLLVIAAIALLVGGFIYLWNTNEDFKNAVIDIWTAIVDFLKPILEGIRDGAIKAFTDMYNVAKPYIEELKDFIINNWTYVKEDVIPKVLEIKDKVIEALKYMWETIKPVIEELKKFIVAAWDFILAATKVEFELLKVVITTAFNIVKQIFTNICDNIKYIWDTWGDNIVQGFKIAWDTIVALFKGVIGVFTGIFEVFTGVINGDWQKAWDGVKQIVSSVWDALKSIVKNGVNFLINALNGFINGINKVKIPDFVPGVGGKGFNIPHIPLLASGGIATRPTLAMIGEGREDEAVLPLSKLQYLLDISGSKEDKENKNTLTGPLFVIENFVNNTDNDIEKIMQQMEFYRKRAEAATGGGGVW